MYTTSTSQPELSMGRGEPLVYGCQNLFRTSDQSHWRVLRGNKKKGCPSIKRPPALRSSGSRSRIFMLPPILSRLPLRAADHVTFQKSKFTCVECGEIESVLSHSCPCRTNRPVCRGALFRGFLTDRTPAAAGVFLAQIASNPSENRVDASWLTFVL